MAAYAPTSPNGLLITGNLENFGVEVRATPTEDDDLLSLPEVMAAPEGDGATLTLSKTYSNTMDTGLVSLHVTLKTLDTWGADDTATVLFPPYYRPDLGVSLYCSVSATPVSDEEDAEAESDVVVEAVTEDVHCEVSGDW
jgi:hypothetical protein